MKFVGENIAIGNMLVKDIAEKYNFTLAAKCV